MLGNGVFLNVCPWDFLDMFIRGGNKRLWGNDHRLDGEKALFCIKKHKKWLIFSIISLFHEEIENKSLLLCNKLLNMEDINRIKMLEVDIKELLVREYKQYLLSQNFKSMFQNKP